jgi:hypothetical protein
MQNDIPRRKKIPAVLVSYRKKIRVGRSEIIFFSIFFSCFFSIISVTTDAILAAARNHPEKIGSVGNRNHRYYFYALQHRLVKSTNLSTISCYTLILHVN